MELPRKLSAKYKGSFAYYTIRDRLPVILTRAIDGLSRKVTKFKKELNEDVAADAVKIISKWSKLRNEIQTDKNLTSLEDEFDDLQWWNDYMQKDHEEGPFKWFTVSWLFAECYMYRRVFSAILTSQFLKSYDPFEEQKRNFVSDDAKYQSLINTACISSHSFENFTRLLQCSLWGNMFDLSFHAQMETKHINILSQLSELRNNILCNEERQLYSYLEYTRCHSQTVSDEKRIDFILDNAGPEAFFDLCLAEYMYRCQMADYIYFHVKSMPWFVSDVTKKDVLWQIERMRNACHEDISNFGNLLDQHFQEGKWQIVENTYWSTCYDYDSMNSVTASLYKSLQKSTIIIFKGDLNYRKLIGDLDWPHTTNFSDALRSFRPAPLVALRTLKADLVAGLPEGVSEKLSVKEKNWMISGKYGVIQFCE